MVAFVCWLSYALVFCVICLRLIADFFISLWVIVYYSIDASFYADGVNLYVDVTWLLEWYVVVIWWGCGVNPALTFGCRLVRDDVVVIGLKVVWIWFMFD